jgi:hypothetical protein
MTTSREGGCFCGAVRYRATAEPGPIIHCHCSDCRRTSGAAFVSWVEVPVEAFEWTGDEPTTHAHPSDTAPRVERTFCPHCGTVLTFHRPGEPDIDLTVASLDDAAGLKPGFHLFVRSAVDWVLVGDDLPRYRTHRGDRS